MGLSGLESDSSFFLQRYTRIPGIGNHVPPFTETLLEILAWADRAHASP
jgi:hypothetical protein